MISGRVGWIWLLCLWAGILWADPVAEPDEGAVDPTQVMDRARAELDAGRPAAAREWIVQIQEPAARLYFQARADRAEGNLKDALRHAASVVVFHYRQRDWIARAEWLCAQLYIEAGMPEAAEVTARQVMLFYTGTDLAEQAGRFVQELEEEKGRTANEPTEGAS